MQMQNEGELFRTADQTKFVSKCDTTNCSYELNTTKEIVNCAIPTYQMNISTET